MQIDILPSNLKTITLRVRERGKYLTASVTLPPDLIKRYKLADGEDIVLAYICRANETPEKAQRPENPQKGTEES